MLNYEIQTVDDFIVRMVNWGLEDGFSGSCYELGRHQSDSCPVSRLLDYSGPDTENRSSRKRF